MLTEEQVMSTMERTLPREPRIRYAPPSMEQMEAFVADNARDHGEEFCTALLAYHGTSMSVVKLRQKLLDMRAVINRDDEDMQRRRDEADAEPFAWV